MADARLVLPHDLEGVFVDVIKRRHPEHLAKLERVRGVDARTYKHYATVVRMADSAADRLSGDDVPACLLGVIGAPAFVRNENDGVDAVFQMGMQVTVMGSRRVDTLLRRDAYAWTTIECVYQRVPRGSNGLVDSVELVDYEPLAESDTQRTLGDARMVWEVGVRDVLTITGGLPADDNPWPPDAGGAPEDPYDPVPPGPEPNLTFTLEREPLVE
jgi:hypothetical protein